MLNKSVQNLSVFIIDQILTLKALGLALAGLSRRPNYQTKDGLYWPLGNKSHIIILVNEKKPLIMHLCSL